MSFTIQAVAVDDADGLASVMTDSRWCDPHWKALFQESTSSEQVTYECAQRLPWNLINDRARKRHQKAVDVETGEVIGYARWILPAHLVKTKEGLVLWEDAQVAEANPEQRRLYEKQFKDNTDGGRIRHLRRDLLAYRSTPLEEVDAKLMKDGPYLELDYLSTAPKHQRRGVGSLMLESGLKIADIYGLKTIVTASPAGLRLYLSHGFELVQTVSVDYSQFGGVENTDNHFMIRQPLEGTQV